MNKIYLAVTAFLVVLNLWISKQKKRADTENVRLELNQKSLMSEVDQYRIKDSINVRSSSALLLKLSEAKQLKQELYEEIEHLKTDIKRVRSVSRSSAETRTAVSLIVHDTTILIDSIPVLSRKASYRSTWFDLDLELSKDSIDVDLVSRDSLIYVEHLVPKKFLFIKYGVKRISQEIYSKNPNTKITSSEFIILSNRKQRNKN